MKKIALLLMLVVLLAVLQTTAQDKKHTDTCRGYAAKTDTQRVIVTNIPNSKEAFKLDSASTVAIVEEVAKGKTQVWDWLKWVFPLVISFTALWFTIRNQRRDKTYKDLAFLTEVDKMLVNNPELWAIYNRNKERYLIKTTEEKVINIVPEDGSKPVIKMNENEAYEIAGKAKLSVTTKQLNVSFTEEEKKKFDDKLIGFCYFKLNNFEAAVENNHNPWIEDAWDKYMVHTILRSCIFENVLRKEEKSIVYSLKFREKIHDFLSIADHVRTKIKERKITTKEGIVAITEDDEKYFIEGGYEQDDLTRLENLNKLIEPAIEEKRKEIESKWPIKRFRKNFKRWLNKLLDKM